MTSEQSGAVAGPTFHPVHGPALAQLGWTPAPRYLLRRDRVLRALRGLRGARVLDIGCGAGALLRELAQMGHRGAGLERSAQARALAAVMNPPGGPVEIRAEPAPDWDGAFDVLCCFEVLEHIEDDLSALRAWTRMLRPGGLALLSVPSRPELWGPADVWAGHVRRYRRPGFRALIEGAGLRVERIESYGFPLANLMEPLRHRVYARQLAKPDRAEADPQTLTLRSGADRRAETRIWPLLASWPGSLAMRAATLAQRPFLRTDLGNGYLAVARKP
ncbi:class I SAM-dependent methyltransferase [Oceanicella actignis]|uniref:2-polyprenyl-3-methyl-5-hydroxy-6-metoxy-1,4-benzoquinol methylase n=1 Tax=Oceanicella actignis TaxID=1189325 RepID=A0A1M7S1D7_9RHOB|nr:class I SAM-dependent methyltransferase [Oceanicella actignis]SES92014.1 2-polyprenyl-3-methyl-5-hydroxy-6-metoxy-1,4-benzoquinol methylase [Oceanicella actignis]SHN52308.1 2-polyprenyl-3-methyl-5-hydroxy-6-metoxy-1,4-benzoquinol methylase [Oceanicella actignis]